MNETIETMAGVKVVTMVFAIIGGLLGISYSPQITARAAFAACLSALVCGSLLPSAVGKYFGWEMSQLTSNGFAVIFGIGGMFIVPGILALWKAFAADPVGFLKKFVGATKGVAPNDAKETEK